MINLKAILVAVTTKYDLYDIDYSLNELEKLANVAGYEVINKVTQALDKPTPKTYIGSGKLEEIKMIINFYNIETVIFNDELTPSQIRNISEYLDIDIIDRSYLILKIFELHASEKSQMLEIKLANAMYMLPRIGYLSIGSDRVGGKGLTRGSGETERELNRRRLISEIHHLQNEILKSKATKTNQIARIKRNELPIVALVGYTNSGKSTTMNTLLNYLDGQGSEVLSKDQLFATLSTYNRKLTYNKTDFMLVDTIGFVSKLPHNLISSFYETLDEVKNADLIIHVIDSSSKYINQELMVVLEVLHNLESENIPSIFLLNKWDNTIDTNMSIPGKKTIKYSNVTKEGIKDLLDSIILEISDSTIHARVNIPYKRGDLIKIIESKATISKREYLDNGTYYDLDIPKKLYYLIKDYDLDTMVN